MFAGTQAAVLGHIVRDGDRNLELVWIGVDTRASKRIEHLEPIFVVLMQQETESAKLSI